MFEYKIKIDKKIIAILGPHLYGDTASIIAELVSNCYDADADNCWVTIKTGASPEIIIEDDGDGMIPEEVNDHFLDIGYNRREERPVTRKGRRVFGRKGIGKLAAFSLSKRIELYSLKEGKKAGCILDYDKITLEGQEPEAIPDENIVFDPGRLSGNGTGTRLVLKEIRRNINNTYYYLVNRIIRNFNVDEFKIHLIKNNETPKTVNYADLNYFDKMDTIVTIGEKFKGKGDIVNKNSVIEGKYKIISVYEEMLKSEEGKKGRFVKIPKRIKVYDKSGEEKEVDFVFEGWIGTILDKRKLRGLIINEGASREEKDSISINDNRITIFSRNRIGEYDILPRVQTDTIYDAYIIGEVYVNVFEDDENVDMAISNRRGYEETDERYRSLIDCLKPLVSYIAESKAKVQRMKRKDEEIKEAEEIKKGFLEKERTRKIIEEKLDEKELEIIQDDFFQFSRATRLSENTRKIFISHNKEHQKYGFFIMRMFELLGVNIEDSFIFTSYAPTGVPHGQNIYDYLKSCFREDIYVIFLFSRHFYDSNVCVAETGAAWATNRNHSNVIIDIGYDDIDKPIDNAKQGFVIKDLRDLDGGEVAKFIKTVLNDTGFAVPSDDKVYEAIKKAVGEFRDRLDTELFYPRRKYQGHPLCTNPKCGNTMELEYDGTELYYVCRTPGCGRKVKAEIY
jgi:hypothetical protein